MSVRIPSLSRAAVVNLCVGALAVMLLLGATPSSAQTSPSAFTTGYRYDLLGRVIGTISPSANGATAPFLAVRKSYDPDGRLVKVETGQLAAWQDQTVAPASWTGFTVYKSVSSTYDQMDRKLTDATIGSDEKTYQLTQYSYDPVGRLQCTAVRMNQATYSALPASACTQGAAGGFGPDQITENVYDAVGQLVQVQKAVGTPIQEAHATYVYSPNGKQTDVIDANGNHSQFVYDGFDRQTQWIFPSPTRPTAFNPATPATALATAGSPNTADNETYSYDANGNRLSLQKRDGTVLGYSYDALNELTTKTVPVRANLPATDSRSVYYTYDLQGHQTGAWFDKATSGQGVGNAYDGFGRKISSSLTLDGFSHTLLYAYDADDDRVKVTHPDGNFVTYAYDGLDRPLTILRSGVATVASFSYNPDGTRASFNSNGGVVATSYGYDAVDRLTSLGNNPTANGAYNNSYGFSYSPSDQIMNLTTSNGAFVFSNTKISSVAYTANGLNQYSAAGSASFGYDANANMTSDGYSTYVYDIENRLVSAGGLVNASLRYDPLGRLYEVVSPTATTRFLYDGDALVAEYDQNGNLLRRYIHGADMKSDDPIAWYEGAAFTSASERFLRPNWQGSIVLVADTSGATVYAANTYDEYGYAGGQNIGRFQYTGQAWIPELGLYYYKARMYSPTIGRFMQTDPIGYSDDLDLYAYVGDDPVDRTDPTGQDAAAAEAVLGDVGKIDLVEDVGTGGPLDPVGDALVAGTTVFGLAVAGYELFQGPQISEANKNPPVPGTGRRAGDVKPAWVKPGQKGPPRTGPKGKKSDGPQDATRGGKYGGVQGSKTQGGKFNKGKGGPGRQDPDGHNGGPGHDHPPQTEGQPKDGHWWWPW